jgi:hypothetical protein
MGTVRLLVLRGFKYHVPAKFASVAQMGEQRSLKPPSNRAVGI